MKHIKQMESISTYTYRRYCKSITNRISSSNISYRLVDPKLAFSLETLAHRQNVASLSIFYGYRLGRFSSEIAELTAFLHFHNKLTC